jgi:TonB family protein
MTLRTSHRWAITLGWLMTAAAATVLAQDPLAKAKDYYASAAYEEALQVLDRLHDSPAGNSTEVAAYQVFCLVALGRSDDATRAIEAIVRTDPLYRPSDAQVSPRVRQFYESIRRPMLPDVIRDTYAKGKDAFAKKDMPAATSQFDEVIALIDEMGDDAEQSLRDLRTLASGFRDLSKAAAAPAPAPPPPAATPPTPTPGSPATSTPDTAPAPTSARSDATRIFTLGDSGVTKPVPVSQMMPAWNPANPVDKLRDFRGTLEIVIDESGKVISAAVTRSVNAAYDPLLVKAAEQWTFKPATRNGKPVKFRYPLEIHLGK